MAKAEVSYAVGREARDQYKESLAGVRYLDDPVPVSPYDEEGELLPGIMPGKPPVEFGASPHPIGYNIRLNLTTNPANKVEIEKPERYDASPNFSCPFCCDLRSPCVTALGWFAPRTGCLSSRCVTNLLLDF